MYACLYVFQYGRMALVEYCDHKSNQIKSIKSYQIKSSPTHNILSGSCKYLFLLHRLVYINGFRIAAKHSAETFGVFNLDRNVITVNDIFYGLCYYAVSLR